MRVRYAGLAALAVVACALPSGASGAVDKGGGAALAATACDGGYCVVGGTSTLVLSEGWRRRAAAAGIQLQATAPAVRRGNRITFPVTRLAGGRYGHAFDGLRSSWYVEGCEVARGGGVFHQGGAVIRTRTGRHSVKALVDGPRFTLEIPAPSTWKTGSPPQPVSLVFSFTSWKVRELTPAGFRAEAALRVDPSLTKGLSVPSGAAGSLVLDVRVSPRITGLTTAVSCSGGPATELPRMTGGQVYPLLGGSIVFGTPMSNLLERFGRPPGETSSDPGWHSALDHVGTMPVLPVDGRTGVQVLLKGIRFDTEDAARSSLRRWETPEGIHIGSTRAEFSRAYPKARIGCRGDDCGAVFTTRPYAVVSEGRPTRQRFFVRFGFHRLRPAVLLVSAELHGEEGRCWVQWRHEEDYMEFEARCFGPLVSARLEPVGASPRFARELIAGADRPSAVDDAGGAYETPLGLPVVRGSAAARGAAWNVECEHTCAPGRGAGPPAWPSGAFEEWFLTFRGYSAQPAPPRAPGAGPKIPPVRFVAEFLGLPAFTIVISRAY